MKITLTDTSQPIAPDPGPGANVLIPKAKVIEMLKSLTDRPENDIPLADVITSFKPFLSNLHNQEIYEKTSGYVQILDEILKQVKP